MLVVLKRTNPGVGVDTLWYLSACILRHKVIIFLCFTLLGSLVVENLRAEDHFDRSRGRINFPVWFEYNGVYCGQLGATWVPGVIGRRKRFTPYYLKIRYLDRAIRKTTDAASRRSLLSRRARIQELLRQHTIACSVATQQRTID